MKTKQQAGIALAKANPLSKNTKFQNGITFFVCIAIPLLVGAISGFFTSKSISTWYVFLNKPFFNPPNYLFAPVWTLLYFLMGIALYRIVKQAKLNWSLIGIFFLQLSLNFSWSFIFFNLQQIGWALLEMILLWASIVAMLVLFYKHDKWAALLNVPYLLWVSFAMLLNLSLYLLN
jgi:translocator protein